MPQIIFLPEKIRPAIIAAKFTQNMKQNAPRTWLAALVISLAAALFVTITGWLLASPSEEITKALSSGGIADVKRADANSFLDAFSSVLVGVDKSETASYVAAAQKLRPDLSRQINAAASEVESDSGDVGPDDSDRVSGHRRRCTICHNHHTLILPCKKARRHLEHHPGDTRGPCTPTPTPTPHH